MDIYKSVKLVVFSLLLLNFIKAGEIEYYWSGAVTSESAVISFATDKKAKIKIQYSDSKNFKKNKRYTKITSIDEKSNFFAGEIMLNIDHAFYYLIKLICGDPATAKHSGRIFFIKDTCLSRSYSFFIFSN